MTESYKYIDGIGYFSSAYVLKREREIERLQKIIDELEKWLKLAINSDDTEFFKGAWSDTLRKLQELKGNETSEIEKYYNGEIHVDFGK